MSHTGGAAQQRQDARFAALRDLPLVGVADERDAARCTRSRPSTPAGAGLRRRQAFARSTAPPRLRATTDPFELARAIDKKIDRIAALARRRDGSTRVTSQMA